MASPSGLFVVHEQLFTHFLPVADRFTMSNASSFTLVLTLLAIAADFLMFILLPSLPVEVRGAHLGSLTKVFAAYVHVAAIFLVVGYIATRTHSLSLKGFSTFLLGNACASGILRLAAVILTLLSTPTSTLCPISTAKAAVTDTNRDGFTVLFSDVVSSARTLGSPPAAAETPTWWQHTRSDWSHTGCVQIVALGKVLAVVLVLALAVTQVSGAMRVRRLARRSRGDEGEEVGLLHGAAYGIRPGSREEERGRRKL